MLIVTTHDRLIEASVNNHNEITKLNVHEVNSSQSNLVKTVFCFYIFIKRKIHSCTALLMDKKPS